MKNKSFIACLLIIMVLFVLLMAWGCSKRQPAEKAPDAEQLAASIGRPFEAKATIRMEELTLTADINKTAENAVTIIVNEPAALSGMRFTYDGQDITVSYLGLSVKLDQDSRLVSSMATGLINAINRASSPGGIHVRMEESGVAVSGQSDSGDFQLMLDPQNGSIASVNLPELDLECRFNDFLFRE